MKQEQDRGITIQSAATTAMWKGHRINVIDTPGHVDFTAEVERSLRVLDGAVTVLDGKNGVEPQTETVWRQATKYNIPRIVFVNKLDAIGADFEMSANSIHQKLGANAVVIEYPIGLESNLRGVIDLVKMVAYNYSTNNPTEEPKVTEIPEEYKDKANEYHHKMLEALANYNDDLMMLVLEGEEPEIDLVKSTIRKATINGDIFQFFAVPLIRTRALDYSLMLLLITYHLHSISQLQLVKDQMVTKSFVNQTTMNLQPLQHLRL